MILLFSVIVNTKERRKLRKVVSNISEYGKSIKLKLLERGENQNWLIEQVKTKTGLYFDSSYLHKVMTGKEKSANVVSAINEILGIEE